MLFSSLTFLFFFLPITLLLYFVVKEKYKNIVLLIVSLLFYAWGEPKYIILMIFSIIVNYFLARLMGKHKQTNLAKFWLTCSIVINILILGFFKYYNFLIENINNMFDLSVGFTNFALPIGLSFYTFQIMSYIIDVYRGKAKVQKNIITLATYISLFPPLIAGPIIRYNDIEEQLTKRKESIELFASGLRRFIIGLGKKVIIANQMAIIADTIFDANTEVGTAIMWVGAIAYALQIYFDFSGYSDMAIGLGKMFGFRILENFNYPYISKSITDFWRRWHISLSSWFRDYVYIPLGGNRVKKSRWIFNMLIVWSITGLWHGAAWNFIIWGVYFFAILVMEKLWLNKILEKLPYVVKWIYAMIFIIIGWVIFRANSLEDILVILKTMWIFEPANIYEYLLNNYHLLHALPYMIIGIVGMFPLVKNILNNFENGNLWKKCLINLFIISILFICITMLISGTYNPFIYFRF